MWRPRGRVRKQPTADGEVDKSNKSKELQEQVLTSKA